MKVSTAKGKTGAKKKPQRHQNSFAFVPSKHSPVACKIAELPTQGLCKRCLEIIQWKKQMTIYKPLSQPKTCSQCHQRSIKDAYHVICQDCAQQRKVCAKCLTENDIIPSAPTAQEELLEKQEKERLIALLNERQKRTYLRKLDRGDADGADAVIKLAASKKGDFSDSDFSDFEE